jgi:hypothetical protein
MILRLCKLALIGGVVAGSTAAYAVPTIVWQDEGAQIIRRANLDGSNVIDVYATQFGGTGLAVDFAEAKVYWTSNVGGQSIQRVNLDGTGFETLVTTGLVVPEGITLDLPNGKMYWADQGPAKISRANLDGTGVEVLITSGTVHPHDIGITGGKMYWTDSQTNDILTANLDGTGLETLTNLNATLGTPSPRGLAVDDTHVYWNAQGYGLIQRSALNGSSIEPLVNVPGWNGPDGIALFDGKIYWTGLNEVLKIQRASLDGTGVEDVITTGLVIPRGIEVGNVVPEPSSFILWACGLLVVSGMRLWN